MTSLVEDLLLLARLDAGRPLEQRAGRPDPAAAGGGLRRPGAGPDHHWRLELPDEPVEVTGDEQRLHQVVTNLLTNARKHTPAGTTVTVTAGAAGGFDRRTTTGRASRPTWPSTPSSGSPAATPRAPGGAEAGSASVSPWSRRSCAPTAARSRWLRAGRHPLEFARARLPIGRSDSRLTLDPRLSDNSFERRRRAMTATQCTENTRPPAPEFVARAEARTAHNYHPLPVVVAHAEGAWMTDVDGRRLPRPARRLLRAQLRALPPGAGRAPPTSSSTSSR